MTLNTTNLGIDKFGVIMRYPTKITNNPQEWYINDGMKTEDRIKLRIQKCDLKGSGVWEMTPKESGHPYSARINICTTNPKAYDEETQLKFGTDFTNLANRGYLVGPEDFRNFELTTYFRIIDILDSENTGKMTGYGRGGLHTGDGWPGACLGAWYKGVISTQYESSFFEKEYHHYSGSTGYSPRLMEHDLEEIDFGNDGTNIWIGQKFIVYDIPGGVKCELWVDKNAAHSINDHTKQDWVKINQLVDKGDLEGPKDKDLAKEMKHHCKCGDTVSPIFAWGGPTVTWRIDNCKVQHTKVSVREIQPPAN
jgi:hypothetical protein